MRTLRFVTMGTAVALAACRAPGAPPASPGPRAEAPPRESASLACGPPIAGADALIAKGRIVLVGEMHGTREFPALIGRVACEATRARDVVVALEIPDDEQPAIDGWLRAPSADAAAALFRDAFWTRDAQDGRSSAAMRALLEDLGATARATGKLRVVAIDRPEPRTGRDEAMAQALAAAHRASPGALVIALTGNVHNRMTRGVPWDADYEPMGLRLARTGAPVLSLAGTYEAGSEWACSGAGAETCGIKELNPSARDGSAGRPGPAIRLLAQPGEDGIAGTFHVGAPSASPPANAR